MGTKGNQFMAIAVVLLAMCTYLANDMVVKWTERYLLVHMATGFLLLILGIITGVCVDIWRWDPVESHTFRTAFGQYLGYQLFLSLFSNFMFRQFTKASKDCRKLQDDLLLTLLKKQAATEYGKTYGFKDIKSREEFVSQLPLAKYDHFEPWIDRMGRGEENILFPEKVVYFAVTSGTTGKNKRFPLPASFFSSFLKVILLPYYSLRKYLPTRLYRTAGLLVLPKVRYSEAGIEMSLLAHLFCKRSVTDNIPAVPGRCYEVAGEKNALYARAVFMLAERDIGTIDGFMAPLLHSFFKVIEENYKDICDNIRKGKLSESLGIDDELLDHLNSSLHPDPQRALEVEKEIEAGNICLAQRLWPNLKYITVTSTGAFAHYFKVMADSYIKGIPQGSHLHGSSEGIIGLTTESDPSIQVYTLAAQATFFELIPEEDMDKEHPQTVFIDQAEKGRSYEIVITNNQGLYRYRLGDVIKVVGFFNQIPKYEFGHRSGQMLNCSFEKTPENVFYQAVSETVKQWGDVRLLHYTATENIVLQGLRDEGNDNSKRYVLFVEVDKDGKHYRLTATEKQLFDQNLCEVFVLYNDLREKGTIGPMEVIQVELGAFDKLKESMTKEMRNPQFKMPTVLRKTEYLPLLLSSQLN